MHGWDLDSYANRARAFGWHAIEIDGHNVEEIDQAYGEAIASDRPVAIVARTIKGKGVKAVEDKPGWHGKALDNPDGGDRGARRDPEHRRPGRQAGDERPHGRDRAR
jgi:transketolase